MNLAVHGLAGDIREANTYYEDPHDCVGKFDFVMANPPFNQNAVNKDRIKDDKGRFPFGMPNPDNANFLWIQLFYTALADTGRAGFVMANSAGDARGSEAEIRRKLVETGGVDAIISLSSNLFYTVTLPATLWFLVRVTDLQNETVEWSNTKRLHPELHEKYKKHTLRPGDLVIATVGSHPTQPGSVVGRPAIMPSDADGALLNQNAVCIRSNSERLTQAFLGFVGRAPFFRE